MPVTEHGQWWAVHTANWTRLIAGPKPSEIRPWKKSPAVAVTGVYFGQTSPIDRHLQRNCLACVRPLSKMSHLGMVMRKTYIDGQLLTAITVPWHATVELSGGKLPAYASCLKVNSTLTTPDAHKENELDRMATKGDKCVLWLLMTNSYRPISTPEP